MHRVAAALEVEWDRARHVKRVARAARADARRELRRGARASTLGMHGAQASQEGSKDGADVGGPYGKLQGSAWDPFVGRGWADELDGAQRCDGCIQALSGERRRTAVA